MNPGSSTALGGGVAGEENEEEEEEGNLRSRGFLIALSLSLLSRFSPALREQTSARAARFLR